VVGIEYPDKVFLCILCIPEEMAQLPMRLELGQVGCDDVCGAFGTEWSEVGQVHLPLKPELKGGGI
jgi:hypothetical protein